MPRPNYADYIGSMLPCECNSNDFWNTLPSVAIIKKKYYMIPLDNTKQDETFLALNNTKQEESFLALDDKSHSED